MIRIAVQDKVLLMHDVEGTLRPRMFATMLDEALVEIQDHLDHYDVTHIAGGPAPETDDLLKYFLMAKQTGGRSEKTLAHYQFTIERFMRYVGCRTRDVSTAAVRAYLQHEQNRGIADSTVEGTRQLLNNYFRWLEQKKLIHSNPVFDIDAIKVEKKVRKAFSDQDMEKIRRTCKNLRDIALINFFFSTGCRVSEAIGVNIQDVDFSAGELVVYGKGKKQRTVYQNDVAAMTLKEYLSTRSDRCEALFVNRYGNRISPSGIRAMLIKLAKQSGVESVHPHRFRRTTITYLLNRGMPVQDVSIIAGHEKIDTTMKYYHSSNARIKSSYQRCML